MTKTEIHSYKANMDCNAVQHVAPVAAPSPPAWPPAWLAALTSPPDGPQKVNPTAPRLRGWRLPNGVVVCRCCCPKPADAVPVVLADGDGGPQWVEEPASYAKPGYHKPQGCPITRTPFQRSAVALNGLPAPPHPNRNNEP